MSEASSKPFIKLLGQRIGKVRQKCNVTQSELAKGIGVSFQQIQNYEYGKSRIPVTRLIDIAQFLQVDVKSFFEDVEDDVSHLLSEEDAKYFEIYRNLSSEKQNVIQQLLQLLK